MDDTNERKELRPFEYVWACWPLALVVVGGAVGGLCGGAAAGINVWIFHSSKGTSYKYVVTLLVSLGAIVTYVVIAGVFALMFPDLIPK